MGAQVYDAWLGLCAPIRGGGGTVRKHRLTAYVDRNHTAKRRLTLLASVPCCHRRSFDDTYLGDRRP